MANYFAIVVLQISLIFGNSSDFLNSLGFSSINFSQNFVHSVEIKKGGGSGHTKNARQSTKDKHEKADARRAADQKRSNNPNKRK